MIGDALKQAMDPYGSLADSLEQELKKPVRPKVPKGMSASRPKASYSALADSLERELQKPSQVKVPSGMASAGARVGTAAGEVGLSYIPPELEALPNPMGGPPILKGIPGKGKTGMTALEAGTKLNQKQEELAQRLSFLDYFSPFKGTPVAGLTSPSHLAAGAVMAPVQTAASGMILTAPESSWQDRVGAATEILTNFVGPAEVLSGFKILGKPAFNTLLKAVGMKNTPLKRLYLRQLLSDAEKSGINVGKLMQGMEHPGVSVGAKAGIPKMAQVPEGIAGKAKGRAPKTAVPEPPVKPAEVGGGKAKEPWEMTREASSKYLGDTIERAEARAETLPKPETQWESTLEPSIESARKEVRRLQKMWDDDPMPSQSLVDKLKKAKEKLKDYEDRGYVAQKDNLANRDFVAKKRAEILLSEYPELFVERDEFPYVVGTEKYSGYLPGSHKSAVESALREGKPVPPEVLADYPDLAAKYGKGAQAKFVPKDLPGYEAGAAPDLKGMAVPKTASTKGVGGVNVPFGSSVIPEGMVRRFHVTQASPDIIAKEGLKQSAAQGIEGPKAIYSFDNLADAKNYAGNAPIVEFWDDPKNYASHPQARLGDVPPSQITTIRYKWHDELDSLKESFNAASPSDKAYMVDTARDLANELSGKKSSDALKYKAFYDWASAHSEAKPAPAKPVAPKTEPLKEGAWREVKPGEGFEAGREFKMDMASGKNYVKVNADEARAATPKSTDKGPTPQATPTDKPPAQPPLAGEPPATGLANQVQGREAEAGILKDIPATAGKSPEHWQQVGKKEFGEDYDFEALASRVASGDEELTGAKVGILLEGKRRLMAERNRLSQRVKDSPGDKAAKEALAAHDERIDAFVRDVQVGKGAWSDVGRALQAGAELDTGNYAQVIQAAKRAGNVGPKLEAQLQKQSATIADLNEKLAAKDAEIAKARAEGGVTRATARKATRQAIQQEREAIFKEIDDLFKEAAGAGLHAPASAAYTAVKAGSKLAAAGGKLALNYAKEGITLIDEIAERVIRDFRSKGLEIDRQTIIDEMAKPQRQTKTKNEIQKALMSLRAQVKRESTANKAKIQGEIESLQKQLETGDFRTPSKREMILSKELEALRAERDLHAARVRSAIHSLGQSTAKKVTQEVAGAVRGTILGTDFGILTRQGLFGLSRPVSFAKSTGKAVQAMLSEKNLVRIENDILSHDVAGQTAGVVYRKHGLGLSSYLTHPEELVVGKLIRRIPGIGRLAGTLERGQSAFINTLRSEMFDRAIRLGYKDNELLARANFINSATGRSNAKNIPTALEFIMTSPRYERSRWEMLAQPLRNPAVIIKDLATKKGLNRGAVDNLQDMAVTAAEVYGLYKLAEASGYTTNFDPTSSDFLKMRKGDEVWDPSAGIAPRLRDMMRFVAWSMEPSYHDNVLKVIGQSAVRPLSPSIRQPLEVGSQQVQRLRGVPEDKMASVFTGWKLDEDEKGWITFAPLIVQTVKKYLDKGDAQGAMDAAWKEFIGQSVNRYAPPKPAK